MLQESKADPWCFRLQRRKLPHGYPYAPRDNPTLKKLYEENSVSKRKDIEDSEEKSRQVKGKILARSGSMMSFTAERQPDGIKTRFGSADFEYNNLDLLSGVAQAITDEAKKSASSSAVVKKSMRWMHKLEVEPKGFNLKMTDEQLRQLWEPTFTLWERW